MSLHSDIKNQIKDAMRAKDSVRLTVLRSLVASFTNELISKQSTEPELKDEEALAIIKRSVKQHKDSIDQFEKGGRPELAESEKAELSLLEAFLPQTMSKEEIKKIALEKIAANGGTLDKSKLGQFMGGLMKDLKGKAEGADVKSVLEEIIALQS